MNDYLEIFSDVVLLATFQPRHRERHPSPPAIDGSARDRQRTVTAADRRFRGRMGA
ncbi:hypothetical protein [Mesorhizobium marinum]|uniref:hypothetical protein n=1 Tax=Mesorhizobium marinum TaxID=3228790 RepID=UPI003465D58D